MRNWGLCLFTVFAGLVLAIIGSTPPAPESVNSAPEIFSAERAMTDVRIISEAPHPTGTTENTVVRTYLAERLTELGLEVSVSERRLNERSLKRFNRWGDTDIKSQPLYNIIGVLPGTDRSLDALLLMAHHDTVPGSPGAADDTIGIASIMEIVRAVKDTENRQRDLIVLFTDAEEIGLDGARHFFKDHPLRDKIGAVINFEARGAGGTANMFQTSADNGHVARLYAKTVHEPSASSLSIFVYNILPNDTDLTPALDKDYAAYNIANIGRAGYYHSPKITADALSPATLQHMGSQGLDLTRALLTADPLPAKNPDATFFDVFGLFTVLYAPALGWVFLLLAVIFYVLSVRRNFFPKPVLGGALKMAGLILIGGLSLYALNRLSGSHNSPNYYDRLAAIHELEAVAVFLAIAVFAVLIAGTKPDENSRLGLALPILVLGIAGQALAPTATYFISLALLLCALASLCLARWPQVKISLVVVTLTTALVFGYMLTLGHLLMLGVGPDMLSVAILPAAIAAMAIAPLLPDIRKQARYGVAIVSLGLVVGIALFVRFDAIAATVPAY